MEMVLLRFILALAALLWGLVLFILTGLPRTKTKDSGVALIRIPLIPELLYSGVEALFLVSQLGGVPGPAALPALTIGSELIRLSMALIYIVYMYRHFQVNEISLKGYLPLKALVLLTAANYLIHSLRFLFPGISAGIRFISLMILSATLLYAGICALTVVIKKKNLLPSTWAGFWIAAFSLTIHPFIATADALALNVPGLDQGRLVSLQTRPVRLLLILAIATFYLIRSLNTKASRTDPPPEELSDREKEIFLLLTHGKSNRQISEGLNIALPTVKTHVSSILRKYSVSSRSQLRSLNGDGT